MILQLFQFESFYQSKQRSLWALSIVFLLFGIMLGGQGFAPANVNFNSPYQIYYYAGLFTLGSVFIIMFFVVSGVLRDRRHDFEHLIYTTAIKKSHFFINRYLGVFSFSLLTFSAFLPGFLAGTLQPGLDPDRLSVFDFGPYLISWLYLVVPNIFVGSVVLFCVGLLSKNAVAVYVTAVAIYLFYIIGSMYLNSPLIASASPSSPEELAIAALIDPFGLSAFFEQTQFWTPFEKNTQIISFSGYFLWNRMLWCGLALGLLLMTYKRFSFRELKRKPKRKLVEAKGPSTLHRYQPVQVAFRPILWGKVAISMIHNELKRVFRQLPFLGLFLIWVVVVLIEILTRIKQGGAYNDSWYPSTNLLIDLFSDPITPFAIIIAVFYGGELLWREKELHFDQIINCLPVPNFIFFLSKLVTLIVLPMLLIVSAIIISLFVQVFLGYYEFEMGQYLSLFYYRGSGFVFYCLIVIFIQSLAPGKYLGMGISALMILLLGTSFSAFIGLEHPMLKLGAKPFPSYSNMTGYTGSLSSFHHYTIYWTSLGGILALVSAKIWRRGTVENLVKRIKLLFSGWSFIPLICCLLLVCTFLLMGWKIYHNLHHIGNYQTVKEENDYRELYERKYKQYEALPRLFPSVMKTVVDLYPSEKKYSVQADYYLKNRTDTTIWQVFITERHPLSAIELHDAVLKERDSLFGTYLFQLKEPLSPGDSLPFSYQLTHGWKGYETDQSILSNGSYIMHGSFEPVLSYRGSLELKDAFERQKRGLPVRPVEKPSVQHMHSTDIAIGKTVYEAIVSTESGQTALACGDLKKAWEEGNRSYFHYQASGPIVPFLTYFSASYEKTIDHHEGIRIEQYYHPGHEYNVQRIANNSKSALSYCLDNFGNYPYDHLRIAEMPSLWGSGGVAHPGTIGMVEDNLYLLDVRDTTAFDLVTKRTIHEVAHQWWGMTLTPKVVEGGALLVEGFAKYTEGVVMEKTHGLGALRQISATANNGYFTGRAYARTQEPPLFLEDGQNYLAYGKSFLSMMALRELIGEQKINQVLREMIQAHHGEEKNTATSLEFLERINAVTDTVHYELINDWFRRVITYDLSIEDASYHQLPDGKFQVSLSVRANRFQSKGLGEEVSIGIDEPISIGVFKNHPKNVRNEEEILYYQQQHIDHDNMKLTLIVDAEPAYIAIDPIGTRPDKDHADNVKALY